MKSTLDGLRSAALRRLGKVALDRFARSTYARRHVNSVPTTLICMCLRGVVNALIMFRLATGVWHFDFFLQLLVTVMLAVATPLFYALLQDQEDALLAYTNHVMDRAMGPGGLDYVVGLRNRAVGVLGVGVIGYLYMVPVDSAYLMQTIVHFLLSFFIIDQIQQLKESLSRPFVLENVQRSFIPRVKPHRFSRKKHVIPLAMPHTIRVLRVRPHMLETPRGQQPVRARIVTPSELIQRRKGRTCTVARSDVVLFNNYGGSDDGLF